MTFLNGTTEISTNGDFKNIPIRRNYRTNVSGNLLTKQGTFNVTIDPEFYKPTSTTIPNCVPHWPTAAASPCRTI